MLSLNKYEVLRRGEIEMFKNLLISVSVLLAVSTAYAANQTKIYDPMVQTNKVVIKMELLDKSGNKNIGNIVAIETSYGVALYPNLKGLVPGVHGFHVHQNPDCGMTDAGNGMKAGGHWDPEKKGKHSFPWDDDGHKGDLPSLIVSADGVANIPVMTPKIRTLKELRGHALMIHVGGDNFHDQPTALGGGGARMACGVIAN